MEGTHLPSFTGEGCLPPQGSEMIITRSLRQEECAPSLSILTAVRAEKSLAASQSLTLGVNPFCLSLF